MFGSRFYDHAFLTVTAGVTDYLFARIPGDDKVDFIFERRPELKECISVYEELFEIWPNRMARAGTCVPSDDDTNVALQMADLLSWEFLQITDRNEQSEAFRCINEAHQIIYLPCTPPEWFPHALALHAFGQKVKDSSDVLQKRIYGDHENSVQLVEDVKSLISSRILFDALLKQLCETTDSLEYFSNYVKESDEAEEQIRKRNSKAG